MRHTYQKSGQLGKVRHNWKSAPHLKNAPHLVTAPHLEKCATFRKIGDTCKNGLHVEKWVTPGKMGHILKKKTLYLENLVTIKKLFIFEKSGSQSPIGKKMATGTFTHSS